MNLTYIVGTVLCIVLLLYGMLIGDSLVQLNFAQLGNFWDPASVLIVIGGTITAIVSSFPGKYLSKVPKHIGIVVNAKKNNAIVVIDELVEFAQIARKNGLLALEERANQLDDPFFKKSIMLIVDGNDADKVKGMLLSDIEQLSMRHDGVASMYEKASAAAPAFGMAGTLIGLINMLNGMDPANGSSSIGKDMGVAMITTLYGVFLANIIFNPIASGLRLRDEQECLCRQIIVEGVMAIQSGENPKFIREKLEGFLEQSAINGNKKKGGGGGGEE